MFAPCLLDDRFATTGSVTLGIGYNPASQITTETRNDDAYAWTGDYNVTRAYAANGLNQYTAAGPASFTYDANGNLTSDGSVTYGYDVENRIIGASGAKTATLKYDPLGRLYEVSGGATPTRFLYDTGMGAAAGVDALLAEYDATSGALTRRYVHGPGLDEPLVWYEGSDLGNPRYLHANHQGSIIGIANASGQSNNTLTYDPYGIPGTQNFGRFQYTGQIWLNELGLYHYKARAYSPTLGRFLQTDPIGYDDQINLYAYVGNDPGNGRDPSGMECVTPQAKDCGRAPISAYVRNSQPSILERRNTRPSSAGEPVASAANPGARLQTGSQIVGAVGNLRSAMTSAVTGQASRLAVSSGPSMLAAAATAMTYASQRADGKSIPAAAANTAGQVATGMAVGAVASAIVVYSGGSALTAGAAGAAGSITADMMRVTEAGGNAAESLARSVSKTDERYLAPIIPLP